METLREQIMSRFYALLHKKENLCDEEFKIQDVQIYWSPIPLNILRVCYYV